MDRIQAMQFFVRVAESGSFAAVAQQLGVDRSMVTRQIAALENHLGAKLMVRSTRRLSLTSAGAAYLEKSRLILNLLEAAESEVADERRTPRGHIRLAVPLSFGLKRLTPLLIDFAERYPDVSLDLDFNDRRSHLIEEGIDLSLRITRQPAPGDIVRRLGEVHMKVVAAPAYLARRGRPQHPADLAEHEYLGYTLSGRNSLQFTVDDQPLSVALRSRFSASNGEALVKAAERGLGITCHPDFIVEAALRRGSVVSLLDDYPLPPLGIFAILPTSRQISHRVRVLIDFLAEALGQPTGG